MMVRIYRGCTSYLQGNFRGYSPSRGALGVEMPVVMGTLWERIRIIFWSYYLIKRNLNERNQKQLMNDLKLRSEVLAGFTESS
jgi:hypothetical protein